MNQKLLKGGDIAALLNISRTQAFILMQRGEIPTIRFGKSVRVRVEDLDHFIEAKRTTKDNSQNKTKPVAPTTSLVSTGDNPNVKKESPHE